MDPWLGKIPWRREWLPTPIFWPGEFHGLYSPRGLKELDTTERLNFWFRKKLIEANLTKCNVFISGGRYKDVYILIFTSFFQKKEKMGRKMEERKKAKKQINAWTLNNALKIILIFC